MGEYLIRSIAAERGVDVEVCSGGTGGWHLGEPAHPNSLAALSEIGIDATSHRARMFEPDWFDSHDLILVMDRTNERDVLAISRGTADSEKVKLVRFFDPTANPDAELEDPYGLPLSAYQEALMQLTRAINGLFDFTVSKGLTR